MKRRAFIRIVAASAALASTRQVSARQLTFDSQWRDYELKYDIDLSSHHGKGRLWLPVPQDAGDYQRVLSVSIVGDQHASLERDRVYGAPVVSCQWHHGAGPRIVSVTSRVSLRRNRARQAVRRSSVEDATTFLQPTPSMPVDGIVAETAHDIVRGVNDPDERARAIYEWVVDNTFRDPKVEGCGMGDIKWMLETGNLKGKCADINSLFVGLARAAGLPAREVYGVRIDDSTQFRSLGKSGDVSKAQHCRAEYFSNRFGWVPVDPADVRKVVLEEKLSLDHPKVVQLRERLFGNWEMNWVGFNYARDFQPKSYKGESLAYLMYPHAEFGDLVLNGRRPDSFKFTLFSERIA